MSARPEPPECRPVVCYLTKRFPRLSETFILDEILGLEANGIPLRLFAIADPAESAVQPDVGRVASPVTYLRTGSGWRSKASDYARFFRAHGRLFWRDPSRWCAVVGHIAVARRSRASVKHFLEAGAMATEMEAVGGDHLHAAFAHGPASIAHFVHLLTGKPFSFAAHAKDLYLSTPDILATKVAASTFVLACSSSAATELRRIVAAHPDPSVNVHTDKVVLAPHGVDIDRFRPEWADRPPDSGRMLRVLAVGRLVAKKGYPTLLAALAALDAAGVNFRCHIVGGGPLRDDLADMVARFGLDSRVTLCGTRTQQQIVEEYHHADVFVQASVVTADGDRDGIPNSVLEAMASGLAVVATAVAGIPEVVRNAKTGFLVDPSDSDALAGALKTLAADPELGVAMGGAARCFVVDHFSRRECIGPVALLLSPVPAKHAAHQVVA